MKKISIFLKLLLSLSLIGCLIYYELIDLNLLKDFSFDDYILIILINFFIFFLATLRWHLILKSYAIYNNFLDILKLNLISIFFGNFFVGQYGGDFVRGYYIYKKKKENRINAVLSIIFDRFFGLLGLISIVLILCLVNQFNLFFEILIFFITIGLILIAFFFIFKKIKLFKNIINKFKQITFYLVKNPLISFLLYIISFVQFLIIISVVLIIIEKIYPGQNLIDISLASSMAFFVNAIPITPGGIGLGEGSFQIFTYLLTNLDLKFATIFLINRVFYFLSSLVGGLVYLFYKN